MLRDLDAYPLWQAEDLGKPVPDDPHAVSVALPLWQHVVGYEEGDPAVIETFQAGYPRFFCHPKVEALFAAARDQFARAGDDVLVFPTEGAADRCRVYLKQKDGVEASLAALGETGLHVVRFPEAARKTARFYWRISGDIVSSRLAEAALANGLSDCRADENASPAHRILRERLAGLSGNRDEDVFLFPSGMCGVSSVHRALLAARPGRRCVQLDFPYVDVLKVQQEIGPGAVFLGTGNVEDLEWLEALLRNDEVSGIYCEFPSNPLLRSVNLERVSKAARAAGVPLIVDDTIASVVNVDVYPFADAVTTSLTKYFSGVGNVMAGSVILNRKSPFHDTFRRALQSDSVPLWHGDADVLEHNSRDFPDRMAKINAQAVDAYHRLKAHPAVAKVYFPLSQTPELYQQAMRPGAGYGGLLSLILKDASQCPAFYDALKVTKGPSLGTNFSIACPYTLLAHYTELPWAELCGVDRNLIRISIGVHGLGDSQLPRSVNGF
ncbi:MAG: PLP-dependent transferase [Verrucomicrobiae bacterium]|nr:PLP-dependent transferase [Verrucomicrobiae bacterium]